MGKAARNRTRLVRAGAQLTLEERLERHLCLHCGLRPITLPAVWCLPCADRAWTFGQQAARKRTRTIDRNLVADILNALEGATEVAPTESTR